jgi:predicted Zn-dependent protease
MTVKAPHRSALKAAGIAAAFAVVAVPSLAGAQRQQVPGPDTRKVLVTTFRGDPEGGVKAADEIRNRIAGDFSIRTLMPNPKKDIDATLVQSGYKPDSALSPNDIKELAKLLRADEIIDGTVTKTATGYRVNARMFLPRDASLSQPLITVESNNMGDVAKQVVREYDNARKQLKDTQDCENGLRANTPAVAIAAARKGIATYPKGTLARLCLAQSYQLSKTTADSTGPWKDSVIAVTKDIMNLDKTSKIAYQLQYDAYKAKNDMANALTALIGLMGADPTNSTLREQVINELVLAGKADLAIPLTKQLVADNPGDPQYARLSWLVLRAAKNYKESVPVGVAYAALDTAAADSGYFDRQIADLASDSAFAKAAEFAAKASGKYPKTARYLVVKAQNERRAGQLPAAKASLERALQVDPKVNGAPLLLAQISFDLGSPADAVKVLQADVAADATNKERDAQLLLSFGNTLYKAAATSKSADDYKKALPLLQASDAMSQSANAKFLIGVSALQALASSATELQKSKSCDDYKAAGELLSLVNINMPAGGSVNPDVAKQIMAGAAQFQPFVDGSIKKYCK